MARRSDSQYTTPLTCWPVTGLLTVGALIAFAFGAQRVEAPPSDAFGSFNGARVARFATGADHEALRVLMLGNSRLKYATWDRVELERLRASQGLEILRIVNDWAVFSDYAPFLGTILAHPPDLVIVQIELLSQEPSRAAHLRLLRAYLKWRLFGAPGSVWNPGDLDQRELQFATPCAEIPITATTIEERLQRTTQWLEHDPSGPNNRAARAFLTALRDAGVDVRLLAIPRSSLMELARPEAEFAGRGLDDRELQQVWRYPGRIDDRQFCDPIHLDVAGRLAFSAWLLESIAGIRAATAGRLSAASAPR